MAPQYGLGFSLGKLKLLNQAGSATRLRRVALQLAEIYFGGFAGEGDSFAGETAGRGAATGGFSNDAGLGPVGEAAAVGEGEGFFSAMSRARSLSTWSIVDFAIR
jgi:hypothetical protein